MSNKPALSSEEIEARVHRVEILISNVLRIGVLTSLAFVVTGLIVTFVGHPDYISSSGALTDLTRIGAEFPTSVSDVVSGLIAFQGPAIVAFGLLLLVATPVVRVMISILAFVYQGDRTYVVITSVVLILLLLSFILGKAEG